MSNMLSAVRSSFLRDETTTAILEKFASTGIDQFIVSDYCAIEGVSRPTFYSRFGSVHGLVAEIWIDDGQAWLDRLSSAIFSPSTRDVGMALILATARRSSEISEVVMPDLASWWVENTESRSPEAIAWLLANRLGTLLTIGADKGATAALALDPALYGAAEHRLDESNVQSNSMVLTDPAFDDPILDAAYTVIGTVGYHSASLTRIARTAKYTTGALYPQFDNADDLVAAAFRLAQGQIVESNTELWKTQGLSIDSFGAFVEQGLKPGRTRWRRLRLETFIAARPQGSPIAKLARESLNSMVSGVDEAITLAEIVTPMRLTVAYFFHTLGLGMSVLDELHLPVSALNHVEMTRQLVGQVVASSDPVTQ